MIAFAAVIIIIGIIGLFTIDNEQDFIQGQVDVQARYRAVSLRYVSRKVIT